MDRDDHVDGVNALWVLRVVGELLPGISRPGCTPIGRELIHSLLQRDVECSARVEGLDALDVLRFVSSLPVSQAEGCPTIGVPSP